MGALNKRSLLLKLNSEVFTMRRQLDSTTAVKERVEWSTYINDSKMESIAEFMLERWRLEETLKTAKNYRQRAYIIQRLNDMERVIKRLRKQRQL